MFKWIKGHANKINDVLSDFSDQIDEVTDDMADGVEQMLEDNDEVSAADLLQAGEKKLRKLARQAERGVGQIAETLGITHKSQGEKALAAIIKFLTEDLPNWFREVMGTIRNPRLSSQQKATAVRGRGEAFSAATRCTLGAEGKPASKPVKSERAKRHAQRVEELRAKYRLPPPTGQAPHL